MGYKKFYEWYHRDRRLPKRIINNKNFTYRIIASVLDKYCKGNEVLNVGSGVGTIDFYLANKGKGVTGIEISQKAVLVANKSLKQFGLEDYIQFVRGDFLKYKSHKKYDFVICSEVLEHLENDASALKKINYMTAKGGILLLSVPSANAPLTRIGLTNAFDKRSGHLRRYDIDGLTELLKETGFKIIFSQKSEGIVRNSLYVFRLDLIIRIANKFNTASDILTFFDNISLLLFGESGLIVVAKKKN